MFRKHIIIIWFLIVSITIGVLVFLHFISINQRIDEVKGQTANRIFAMESDFYWHMQHNDLFGIYKLLNIIKTNDIYSIKFESYRDGKKLTTTVGYLSPNRNNSNLICYNYPLKHVGEKVAGIDYCLSRENVQKNMYQVKYMYLIIAAAVLGLLLIANIPGLLYGFKLERFLRSLPQNDKIVDVDILKKQLYSVKDSLLKKILARIVDMVESERKSAKELAKSSELAAIGASAAMIAHDIRSPLAALNMVTYDLKQLPEDERVIIRSAVQRIQDIANDLASKKDQKKVSWPSAQDKTQNLQTRLLPSLLSSLISEKRIEYRTEKSIAIEADFGSESYGLFASVQTKEFKRIISNLINNAVEAMEGNGKIKVSLASSSSTSSGSNDVYRLAESNHAIEPSTPRPLDPAILISITDNGKGIPQEILPKLMQKGVSFGKEKSKKSGSGLGLYHAKETIESWGGKIIIESKVDYGTAVTVMLPKQTSPDWFLPEIDLSKQLKLATSDQRLTTRIVILDDDESIHRVWDRRFNDVNFPKENIYHFYSPDQIINWYTSKKLLLMKAPMLVLCDYELLDCEKTGLQVIEELGIEKNAVLVTSHYDEIHIRNNCARLGVKLLPKNLAGFVPICISAVGPKDRRTDEEELSVTKTRDQRLATSDKNCDAILIDDDYLVHTSWKIIAKRCGKSIRCYADPEDFVNESDDISKSTPLYIDSKLGDDVKGEELAKEFFDKGFENIYLATGYAKEDFPKMPWIKGIVGKEPPFLAS